MSKACGVECKRVGCRRPCVERTAHLRHECDRRHTWANKAAIPLDDSHHRRCEARTAIGLCRCFGVNRLMNSSEDRNVSESLARILRAFDLRLCGPSPELTRLSDAIRLQEQSSKPNHISALSCVATYLEEMRRRASEG